MGNTIRINSTASNETVLSMSNQGTDCFFDLILNAASDLTMTTNQKKLIEFLAEQKEINLNAPGNASFDIDEMPWNNETLKDDVEFISEVISKAKEPNEWRELGYEPNASIVVPWLEKFGEMIGEEFGEND